MNTILRKIVMIGPVYPYKGGISHYTSMMYRALSKKYDVSMISFKMQYPRFLYKKDQKDYANDNFAVKEAKYLINTANPFNIANVAKKISKTTPDLVIIPWWHPYFAPCFRIMEHYLKNTKIIFVCHNVFPHEKFLMDKKLTSMVLRHGNAFIVQSKTDETDLLSLKYNSLHKLTPLPTFNAFKMQDMNKEHARRLLNIDNEERILLFFGFVREYKGLKHLINAMPDIIAKIKKTKLLIVGDFGSDRDSYIELIDKNNIKDFIEITEGYIPDKEVEKYFAACDLVVLPYESATQSGIVQIAYSFEKPVVATNVGGLPDVVLDGKTGYLVPAKDSVKLASTVIKYFIEDKAAEFQKNIKNEAHKYSWDRMVEVIEELWKKMTTDTHR